MTESDECPPLLLLPGTLCDARVFAPILPLDARAVLVADLTRADSVADMATDILSAAPETFVAIGFSLGGIVALEIAARAPDRVAALVLIATNCRDVPETHHAARRAQSSAAPPRDLAGRILWPAYVHPDHGNDIALRDTIVAMAEDCPPGTVQRQTEAALSRADNRPRLGALDMPVLVIGGRQDVVATPDMQAELAKGLPNARLEIIDQAGHFVLMEQPEIVAGIIGAWLAGLRGRTRPRISSPVSVSLEVP